MILSNPAADLLVDANRRKARLSRDSIPEPERAAVEATEAAAADGGLLNVIDDEAAETTRVAWRLTERNSTWEYQPWLPTPTAVTASTVVVDHVAATRTASRRLREILAFDAATCVIAITNERLPEATETLSMADNTTR